MLVLHCASTASLWKAFSISQLSSIRNVTSSGTLLKDFEVEELEMKDGILLGLVSCLMNMTLALLC
jgi:hypothetical protein